MKQYWVDYSTSVLIEAENEEEARKKFFENDESAIIGVCDIQIDSIEEDE